MQTIECNLPKLGSVATISYQLQTRNLQWITQFNHVSNYTSTQQSHHSVQ